MQDLPKVGLLYEVYKLCQNISTTIGFTKIRAFVYKCGQKISTYVGFTKIRAFVGKCGQKISTSVGFTKIKAFCAILVKVFLVM